MPSTSLDSTSTLSGRTDSSLSSFFVLPDPDPLCPDLQMAVLQSLPVSLVDELPSPDQTMNHESLNLLISTAHSEFSPFISWWVSVLY